MQGRQSWSEPAALWGPLCSHAGMRAQISSIQQMYASFINNSTFILHSAAATHVAHSLVLRTRKLLFCALKRWIHTHALTSAITMTATFITSGHGLLHPRVRIFQVEQGGLTSVATSELTMSNTGSTVLFYDWTRSAEATSSSPQGIRA
jgi:hypothetical protein